MNTLIHHLLDDMPQAAVVFDAEGRIQYGNHQLHRLLGYPLDYPLDNALIYNDDKKRLLDAIAKPKRLPTIIRLIDHQKKPIQVILRLWKVQQDPYLMAAIVDPGRSPADVLLETTALLTSSLNIEDVLDRILIGANQVVAHSISNVMIREGNRLRVATSRGYEPETTKSLVIDLTNDEYWQRRLSSPQPRLILDTIRESDWVDYIAHGRIRSHIHLPIVYQNQIIGIINISSTEPNHFTGDDIVRLLPFSHQAAITIHNARQYETERQQRQIAEALNKSIVAISGTLNLDEVLNRILDHLEKVIPYDIASIMTVENDVIKIVSSRGFDAFGLEEWAENHTFHVSDHPVWYHAVNALNPVVLEDVRSTPDQWIYVSETDWIRSHIHVPILVNEQLIGFLNLDSQQVNFYSPNDAERLTPFSQQAAIAIKNARLFEAEREQRQIAEALNKSIIAINSSLELDTVLKLILNSASAIIEFDTADIMLIENDTLRPIASRGYEAFDLDEWITQISFNKNDDPIWQARIEHPAIILIHDTHTDPRWKKMPETTWTRSHIGIPIVYNEQLIGFLNFNSTKVHAFTEQQADLLLPLSHQAATAIKNANLFEAERRQRQIAESLRESTAVLNSTLDLDEVLYRLLDALRMVVPHDTANVMILEDEVTLRAIGSHGYSDRDLDNWIQETTFNLENFPIWQRSDTAPDEPIIIDDTHQDPRWIKFPQTAWIRSHLNVPIIADDQIVGFINLDSTQPNFFTKEHARLLSLFSHQAAAAIRNARLFTAERDQRLFAEVLNDSALAINSSLDMDRVLKGILESANRVVPYEIGDIMLLENDGLRVIASRGYEDFGVEEWIKQVTVDKATHPIWNLKMREPSIRLVKDTQTNSGWISLPETAWIRSHIGIPIFYNQELLGFINLNSTRPNTFTAEQSELLVPLTNLAAIALKNARHFQSEQEQSQFAQALIDINIAINRSLELSEVLNAILENAERVFPHDAANIILLENEVGRVIAQRGYEELGFAEWLSQARFDAKTDSIMNKTAIEGEVLFVEDRQSAIYPPPKEDIDRWVRSALRIPIKLRNVVIGFLNLDSGKPNTFKRSDIPRAQAFTELAAIAFRNARAYTSEREQRLFAEALSDIAIAVNSTLDMQAVLQNILDNVGRIVPHKTSNIMLIQDEYAYVVSQQGYAAFGIEDWIANLRLSIHDTYYIRYGLETGHPVVVTDIKTDPHWTTHHPQLEGWMRSHIKVPIILEGNIVGFLSLDSDEPNSFTTEHGIKLLVITYLAATAIRNAQLYANERSQRVFAEALIGVVDTISETLNLQEVLKRISDQVRVIVEYDAMSIMLIEDGVARILSHQGFRERGIDEGIEALEFRVDKVNDMSQLMREKVPLIYGDIQTDPNWTTIDGTYTTWIHSHLKIPIMINDEVVGILNFDSAQYNFFTPEHAERLLVFTDLVATAIRNARLYQAEHDQRVFAEALIDVASTINQTLDLKEVLRRIMTHAGRMVPHDAMTIMLVEGDVTRTYAHEGFIERGLDEYVETIEFKIDKVPDIYQAIVTGQPVLIEDTRQSPRWKHLDDRDKWILSHLKVPIQLDGEVVGFLNMDSATPYSFTNAQAQELQVFSDLAATAIRNARLYNDLAQERAQLAAILGGTGEGIIYAEGLTIVWVNDALCQMTQYKATELIGEPLSTLRSYLGDESPLFTSPRNGNGHLTDDHVRRHEARLRRKDGSILDSSVTISRLYDADTPHSVILVQDISHEKKLRKLQMRFISHAAHEIRQPISNIETRLYLLRKNPRESEKHLDRVGESVNRLTILSEHLSMAAEFDTGRVALQKTHVVLETTLTPILLPLQNLADDRNLDLAFHWRLAQEPIPVDTVMVTQLVKLLVTDALLHTPSGETVTMTFDSEDQGTLVLVLEDNRPPMSQDELDEIFQPFYIPSEGDVVHSGLELTLAKHIIDLHGGSIEAINRGEQGISFTVRLPLD